MDLDEMLRVDRCRDMDELLTFEPDLDHSLDAGTGLLPSISYWLYGTLQPCLAYSLGLIGVFLGIFRINLRRTRTQ